MYIIYSLVFFNTFFGLKSDSYFFGAIEARVVIKN